VKPMASMTTPELNSRWNLFLSAWYARFKEPPTAAQRETLWTAVDACPSLSADWVREAPTDSRSFAVVEFVLAKWKARVAAIPPDPKPGRRTPEISGEMPW
jgi:hypothetical protein